MDIGWLWPEGVERCLILHAYRHLIPVELGGQVLDDPSADLALHGREDHDSLAVPLVDAHDQPSTPVVDPQRRPCLDLLIQPLPKSEYRIHNLKLRAHDHLGADHEHVRVAFLIIHQ